MERDRVFRLSPDAIFRDLDEEAVILDLGSGRYFGLNAVATRIWQLLDEGCSAGRIVSALAAEYDADEAAIEADFLRLIETLESRGLLTSDGVSRGRS